MCHWDFIYFVFVGRGGRTRQGMRQIKGFKNCIGSGCYAWTERKKNNLHFQKNRKIEFLIYAMREWARADTLTICYHNKEQIEVSFSCVWQGSLWIHLAIALWIFGYFSHVVTKFMINKRTEAWLTAPNPPQTVLAPPHGAIERLPSSPFFHSPGCSGRIEPLEVSSGWSMWQRVF